MIVVAILGILASVAIPNFVRFQLKARAGEGRLTLSGLRTAQSSYFGEYGNYLQMAPEPQTSGPVPVGPGSGKRVWGACPATLSMTSPAYCLLSFFPEGPTYFDYSVGTVNANGALGPGVQNVDYWAIAHSDLDGDGVNSLFGLIQTESDGTTNAPSPHAGCVEVYDPQGNPGLRGAIGPCSPGMGSAIF